jgi:predicted transcriptional regulator YheO
MDFSRIIALLNNNLSAREMEDGITEIQNTLIARGFIDRQGNVLLENLKSKLGDEYDSAWHNG